MGCALFLFYFLMFHVDRFHSSLEEIDRKQIFIHFVHGE